jgi:hypothetical protein
MPYSIREIIPEGSNEIQSLIEKIRNAQNLVAMIIAGFLLARVLTVKIIEKILEERASERCKWPRCPKCNAQIESKGNKKRKIKSIVGEINWKRKIGRCPNGCEIGQVAPLDEKLGLEAEQRVSNELKQAGCALAIFVPFQIAARLLKLLTGIDISHQSIWNWVQEAGKKEMARLAKELENLRSGGEVELEPMAPEIGALPMAIGADGVNVPFRPDGGSPKGKTKFQQIKIGLVSRIKKFFNKLGKPVTKIERKRVVAVLGSIEELRDRLWLEALKQNIYLAFPVIWLSDGGAGLWRIFYEKFSHWAQGILDFYHAAQNIWKAASVWLDGRTTKAREWFCSLRHIMRYGQPCDLLNEVSRPLQQEQLSPEAHKGLENLQSYLGFHYQHIEYSRYKQLDFPIGSGMVESTCKWLIQQRFKCVGMRWSEEGFNHLLHLRLAWVNDRFNSLFSIPP